MTPASTPLRFAHPRFLSRTGLFCVGCRPHAAFGEESRIPISRRWLRTRPHEQPAQFPHPGQRTATESNSFRGGANRTIDQAPNESGILYQDAGTLSEANEFILESETSENNNQNPKSQDSYSPEQYRPATTWNSLRTFKASDWDEHAHLQYHGFMQQNQKSRQPIEVEQAVHHALIELVTLKQNGLDFDLAYKHAQSVLEEESLTMGSVVFEQNSTGTPTFRFLNPNDEKALLRALNDAKPGLTPSKTSESKMVVQNSAQEMNDAQETDTIYKAQIASEPSGGSQELEEHTRSVLQDNTAVIEPQDSPDDTWHSVRLSDPEMKFAVFKRSAQLTGLRISDCSISSIKDVSDLLRFLKKTPKAKRLSDEISSQNGRLKGLEGSANVQVFAKKKTTRDKEEEVGRWKVIEEMFKQKGLDGGSHKKTLVHTA
ncbi:uncharacterized protein KY384_005428 [Bacidia gigantensis]|uniref:uncharacterized protein n=1 Tax=Bacidia gigantensis TaxID=2732470 RepID=UPI001D046FF3|nr:uncharacterized protein KY384_005428 [Bacidia gigantensis]KAG8529947.1 hypothetical protein KY384_005428 [Bacidia gigantensis]